jgi:dihydrofolate reductase
MADKLEVVIIAAMARNRVIGINNRLPWSIREDTLHFKELTLGHPCVMGRKTWESLPVKPLPGRENIVISSSLRSAETGMMLFDSLAKALGFCETRQYGKVFICGGGALYNEAIHRACRIELTLIEQNVEGDVFFPEIAEAVWRETKKTLHGDFSFISYVRK